MRRNGKSVQEGILRFSRHRTAFFFPQLGYRKCAAEG